MNFKFFNYNECDIESVFSFFLSRIYIEPKIKQDFFEKDFPYIKSFLSKERDLKKFNYQIYNKVGRTNIVYNFYNNFVIKFGTIDQQKHLEGKKENILHFETALTYNICFNDFFFFENRKFNCIILQPYILSLSDIRENLNEIKENLSNISILIGKMRYLEGCKESLDLNVDNVGIKNNDIILFDW